MDYSTLQTIAIICYMISAGLLSVSVLIFFLMDMRQIIGRLTGSAQRKALARMRSGGAVGKTGETIVDLSVLEKRGRVSPAGASGRISRRSGRVSKGTQNKPVQTSSAKPVSAPASSMSGAPDYFGAPYPNKTPPAPVSQMPQMPDEPRTTIIHEWTPQTTVIEESTQQQVPASPGSETMDLEQWQNAQSAAQPQSAPSEPELIVEEDVVQPVQMTVLDDIVLIHTESFIEI